MSSRNGRQPHRNDTALWCDDVNEVSSDGDEIKLNISKRCDETVSPGLCKSFDAKSNVREPFFKRNVHERTGFEEVQQNAAYCCLHIEKMFAFKEIKELDFIEI